MLSNNQLLQSRGAGFANIDTTQPPIFPIENHGCPKAFHLGRPADHDLIRKPRDSFASETAIQQLPTRWCPAKNQYCQFLAPRILVYWRNQRSKLGFNIQVHEFCE